VTEASARPLRVIGYCRVSTAKQSDNGHGLGAQHEALEHFCAQHGHLLLTVTTDVVSGAASDRMYGREVAIAAIESGLADALLVRALDRATRDQEDAAKLFKRAECNAWRLMDCDKADSGDPSQRLLADIRIAVAAEERRKISERLGHVTEMGDANGQDHPPRMKNFSRIESNHEARRIRIDADNCLVLKLGHLPVLKCDPVRGESVETDRDAPVTIGNTLLCAKLSQRVFASWIGDVRSETVGLQ